MAEILVRRDGAVGLVVISNVPKHNALTPEMCLALGTALEELEADATVRVIAIVGDGERAFVSGADIGQFEKMKDQAAIEPPYMLPLRCEKPVIACVRGICMGGGLGLAAACDIRLCADDAIFRMPATRLGNAYTTSGIERIMSLIGPGNTADLFFSSRKFGADEALRMGLVQRVFPAAGFATEAAAYCASVAENAPLATAASKKGIRELLKEPAKRDLASVEAARKAAMSSADFLEGRAAFMEKRMPVFKGA